MAEQAVENAIPLDWLAHNGSYNIETYTQQKPFVVIEHNVEIKVAMTEMFRDIGHTIIHTDFNYTGMIWEHRNLMSLLNVANNPDVHFIFIPFRIRKWSNKIPRSYFYANAFYHDALYYNNYLNAVVDSFKHRELFGHLDFRCLRVGFDIRCFHGPAAEQKIKRDICWVVQFEANKKHLNWNVVLNTANADITLVITVSRKCYMTGIQCRSPQPQIERMPQPGGSIQMFWPFVQAAESVRVINFYNGVGWNSICLLHFGEAVAAFIHVVRKFPGLPFETVCWLPLQLDRFSIAQFTARTIETHTNIELTTQVLLIRRFIHTRLCQQNGEDLDSYEPKWIT